MAAANQSDFLGEGVLPPQNNPQPVNNDPSGGASFGVDPQIQKFGEQYWANNQDKWNRTPGIDWAQSQLQNFNQPGTGETFNTQNLDKFAAPGDGQQYWNQVQGKFNQLGQYNGPNRSEEAYQATVAAQPGSIQPTFDAAYDRARDTTVGQMNSQAASRGAYGSSAALNGVGSAITDIEAQRANRAGDFALADSANQRAWQQASNSAAGQADNSSLAGFGANLSGLSTFGNLAGMSGGEGLARDQFSSGLANNIQDMGQNRMTTGANIGIGADASALNYNNSAFGNANAAQASSQNYGNSAVNNYLNYLNSILPWAQGNYDNMFNSDYGITQDEMNADTAGTANAQNNSDRRREQISSDVKSGVDLATGKAGL